jgi:hypothetical protein
MQYIVISVYQGVLDNAEIFEDEKIARSYAKRIKKFIDDPQEFDVTILYKEVKKDDILR